MNANRTRSAALVSARGRTKALCLRADEASAIAPPMRSIIGDSAAESSWSIPSLNHNRPCPGIPMLAPMGLGPAPSLRDARPCHIYRDGRDKPGHDDLI